MAGFVFFEKSPRHIDLETARTPWRARARAASAKSRSPSTLTTLRSRTSSRRSRPTICSFMAARSPARVAEVKARFGLPVIKAMGVATAGDVEAARAYEDVADVILFDAKPAPNAAVPGGAGVAFDWSLLRDIAAKHWMLSGGLEPENVAEADAPRPAPARWTSLPASSANAASRTRRRLQPSWRAAVGFHAARQRSNKAETPSLPRIAHVEQADSQFLPRRPG